MILPQKQRTKLQLHILCKMMRNLRVMGYGPEESQRPEQIFMYTGINRCMHPANEGRRYIVTPSFIGWPHTQNYSYTCSKQHQVTRIALKKTNVYCSPGALAKKSCQPEKNVESWNFQEGYLGAHLIPWWKVPAEENFLFKMAAMATRWLLLYPKSIEIS